MNDVNVNYNFEDVDFSLNPVSDSSAIISVRILRKILPFQKMKNFKTVPVVTATYNCTRKNYQNKSY